MQQHLLRDVLLKSCFEKLDKKHLENLCWRKPVLEPFYRKFEGLDLQLTKKELHRRCFPEKFAEFFGTVILENTCEQLFPEAD